MKFPKGRLKVIFSYGNGIRTTMELCAHTAMPQKPIYPLFAEESEGLLTASSIC